MRTCSPADAMRTSLQWWPSPELTFSSRNWAVFPGVLVLGSVSGKRCPPGSTSHHGARYCSREVPATSGTARRVTTQPRWLLHWVITAAQRCNARLHDSPAQFCGKPLLDSPGKGLPPREASTFTNGQDQQARSSLGAVGKPAATQLAPFATSCLLCRRFSGMGTENDRARHQESWNWELFAISAHIKWHLGRAELPLQALQCLCLEPLIPRGEHSLYLPCLWARELYGRFSLLF